MYPLDRLRNLPRGARNVRVTVVDARALETARTLSDLRPYTLDTFTVPYQPLNLRDRTASLETVHEGADADVVGERPQR